MIDIRSTINQAYQLCGILALNETASGTQAQMGVLKLNDIISQMNIAQLFPFSQKAVLHTVTTPQNSYSIGLDQGNTADIQEIRPCFIGRILYYPSINSMPMNVQLQDFADLEFRRKTISAVGSPMYFATDGRYPITNIYFDIKPQNGSSFKIVYNEPIPEVTISSEISVPPEYSNLLICALAKHISVLQQMPSDTQTNMNALYNEACARVTTSNGRSQIPTLDDLMGASNYRTNNILTGNQSR